MRHIIFSLCLAITSTTLADDGHAENDSSTWSGSRPDGHAPIGVMGEHTHSADEIMLSYRYMYMEMKGNRSGTDRLTVAEVLNDFMVSPVNMTMEMHMLGAMYAPSDDVTIMAMLPYKRLTMDHQTRTNVNFTTKSDGIGDFKLSALVLPIKVADKQRIHFNAGISLPTGSINRKGATPMGPNQQLPYPMQLGSGTVDLLPGVTYLGQTENWSWGAQALFELRLGRNDRDYSLGDTYRFSTWFARKLTSVLSSSVRLQGTVWKDIDGADPTLNPMMVPTANPALRGGERLDVFFGLNVAADAGGLAGHRLAIEVGLPVYQSLDGPQLENDWSVLVAWQWAFDSPFTASEN